MDSNYARIVPLEMSDVTMYVKGLETFESE